MARYDFGGTLADFVVTSRRLGGLDVLGLSAATLTFWSAQTGGTRYTDLQLNGSTVSSIAVGTDGQVPKFQGPDGITEMWADGGSPRVRVVTLQGAPGPAGKDGINGTNGLPGVNAVANDTATAGQISTPGTATDTALKAAYTQLTSIATTATASATLAANRHTPVDATSAARTMTLPTAAAGALISVEKTDASANAVTVTGTLRGVASSTIPLTAQFDARTFLSEGGGSWRPVSDHRTAASLDARFPQKANLWVNLKEDFGAKGDGTSDDTAAFTSAIASGAAHVYVPPGTFVTGPLTLNTASQTFHLSSGTTLKVKAGGSQTIATITAANVSILGSVGAKIDGNAVGTTAGGTIFVSGAADAAVVGISFVNCAGLGVNAQGNRPRIENNTFVNTGSTSIYVKPPTTTADLESPRVVGNTIRNTGTVWGMQIQANGAANVVRPKVGFNDIDLPGTTGPHLAMELFGGVVGGSVFSNTIRGGNIGISIDRGSSVAVTGNYVLDVFTTGIELAGCTRCTASGNTVNLSANSTVGGIQVVNNGTGYNTVSGNTVVNTSATGRGVYCQGTSGANTTIIGNSLTAKKPVLIDAGNGFSVVGNNLVSASAAVVGVELNNGVNGTVSGNVVDGATSAAVNAYTGAMSGMVIGPNVMKGGTPAVELINGWVPGTNGTGSRLIRGTQAPAGVGGITVTASPFTYTNVDLLPQAVYVAGGTVSDISKNGVSVFAGTDKTLYLEPGEAMTVTYSVAPTMKRDRK